jgi:hypothetical protein
MIWLLVIIASSFAVHYLYYSVSMLGSFTVVLVLVFWLFSFFPTRG